METNIALACSSLSANRLRTALTITIIAIGITSLVGIETAIEVITSGFSGSFGRMGAGTVSISSSDDARFRPVSRREAAAFLSLWQGNDTSIMAELGDMAEVSCGDRHTDPVVRIVASDENRLNAECLELSCGRNFTHREVWSSGGMCILGDAVARKLFGNDSPLGSVINANGAQLSVCGVLGRQGAILGGGFDNAVIIPLAAAGRFISEGTGFRIDIICNDEAERPVVAEMAGAAMSSVRRLHPGAERDFSISSSDSLQQKLSSIKGKLSNAALIIGLITLLGAAVGLINILLVSVKERTREIGLRKALGEKVSSIRRQFLLESVLIGQTGGLIGIFLGLLAGNTVALIMESSFTMPWIWLLRAVFICLAVSILSGSIPASRAAALNPIDALRSE